MNRFSMSIKRAGCVFTDPTKGQTCVQEHKDKPSDKVRESVRAAEAAFWKAYNDPKWPKQDKATR